MSTATLLIVTTRLRLIGQPDNRDRQTGRPTCAGARLFPLSRARVFVVTGLLALQAPVLPSFPAEAQETIGGKDPQGPCVIVEIAGTRSGHLDCATRRLQDAARIAQGEARAGIDAPVPQAGSPDVRLGVANQAATRLRMGSALGRSVQPERPAARPRTVRP